MNDTNMITPTMSPTADPTSNPTTSDPTPAPIVAPTTTPTTAEPSMDPTMIPTGIPTTEIPSIDPTLTPTNEPTTIRPTRAPYRYTQSPTPSPSPAPSKALTAQESFVEDVKTASFIQITIFVLIIIYLCIGCYVWCHERNKRLKILSGGSLSRRDRAKKRALANARNKQRLIQMQQRQHHQHQPLAQHSPDMNIMSHQNRQNQQLLMSEGSPDFRV